MAKKSEKKRAPEPLPPHTDVFSERMTTAYLVLVAASAVFCFWPLLKYFFAQDDFVLMHRALRDGGKAVVDFFGRESGQFRPLTKVVYFGAAYKAFGLDPAPYHAISLFVHVVNTVLVFSLLKRCRVSVPAALIATTLFALSVAFFHVIAWVSCIQQLLGQCFMLCALITGVDYLRGGPKRLLWKSLGAYLLALTSVEQTFGVPVILLLFALLNVGGWEKRLPFRAAARALAGHLTLMTAYLLFMGVYKGAPQEGPYEFELGKNVMVNLLTYLGWTIHFGVALPARMNIDQQWFGLSHIVLGILFLYHLLLKRGRALVFGLSYFLLAVFPALFLLSHTFYLHTYVAVFGILFLLAIAVDDLLNLPVFRVATTRYAVLLIALFGIGTMSFVMVRNNQDYTMDERVSYSRSFVLRRAMIAKTMYDGIVSQKDKPSNARRVYMVYGRKGGDERAEWNNKNVIAATGSGSLVNLAYGDLEMPVLFRGSTDNGRRDDWSNSDIYVYDDYGTCQRFMVRPEEPGE